MTEPHTPAAGHGGGLPLALTDLRLDGAGEPRILDLDVAARLGFDRPNNIRDLINRNADELRRYGDLVEVGGVTGEFTARRGKPLGGRPGRAFLLNHDQAMIVAVLSRAPRAADVRQQLVTVYNAYRATRAAVPADVAGELDALRTRSILTNLKIERQDRKLAELDSRTRQIRLSNRDILDVGRFVGCCTERAPGERVPLLKAFVAWEHWRVRHGGRPFTLLRFGHLCEANGPRLGEDGGTHLRDVRLTTEAGA